MKKLVLAAVLFLLPLSAFAAFDSNLHYGSTGQDVVALQEFLTDQGVFTGDSTGNFYFKTLRAVKDFQQKQGISPISGYVGPVTRGVINQILSIEAPDSEGDATLTPSAATAELPAIGESVAGSSICIPNPTVGLTANTSPVGSGQQILFTGTYTTGCPLDTTTPWVFKDTDWNKTGAIKDFNYGTVGGLNIEDNVATFYVNGTYYAPETFTFTVGTTTATSTQ